jgi:spore maturation protein CgeB
VQVAEEWDAPEGLAYDIAIHLRGRGSYRPKPGQLNVLWSISHPDDLSGWECDTFDLVAVASPSFAPVLAEQTRTPVIVLEQAVDPEVFHPEPAESHRCDAVFVGNARGELRPALDGLLPLPGVDIAVWGRGWPPELGGVPTRGFLEAGDEVRRAFSSATVVLSDHWRDMREQGYISNRVYDALACGTFVISDRVRGLEERFGDAVACYESPEELRELVRRWAAEPEEARRRAAAARDAILAHDTFDHRAEELLEALATLPPRPRRILGSG